MEPLDLGASGGGGKDREHVRGSSEHQMGGETSHMRSKRACEAEGGYGVDVSTAVMVGDTIETDIEFANNGGMKSLFVLSGAAAWGRRPLVGKRPLPHAPPFAHSTGVCVCVLHSRFGSRHPTQPTCCM